MRRAEWIAARWLGVGLTAVLAVVTIGLAVTGRLGLYINPDSAWFAVSMAVLALVGAVLSFLVPLGAEADHGHDHGDDAHPTTGVVEHDLPRRTPFALAATVTGGILASGVAVATLVLPPASLSVELAMSRDVGTAPLFAGQDVVTLAATGDTASFGIGEWASVFSTSTNPDTFDGTPVTLTGFITPDPADPDSLRLSRLVITHCVIDAQPAAVPVGGSWTNGAEVGDWVEVDGTITTASDGSLVIEPTSVTPISEPGDPYEY